MLGCIAGTRPTYSSLAGAFCQNIRIFEVCGLCLTPVVQALQCPHCWLAACECCCLDARGLVDLAYDVSDLPVRRAKLADYYHARGYAARKQGNFAGAVEEYSRALSLTPSHFKALFNRGFSYDKVRQRGLVSCDGI